ncbi:MAG: hypothetical protein JNM79_01905 [Burkholderiales bacterium]|nr:hypothetical protein [Burkholderiales bacterium]
MHRFAKHVVPGATLLAALVMSGVAHSGTIRAVKVEPASTQVGAQVKVIVEGDDEGVCGLRVEYGNGDFDLTKMSQGKDNFPRSFMKVYNKAGTYTIVAKGGRDGSALGCPGEARATVTVAEAPKPAAAAAPAAAPAAAAKPAAPTCPEGYAVNTKSVNSKTGAYTCTAQKGAKKPEKPLACPTGTEYFASPKGSSLGCRKPAAAAKK